MSSTPTIALFGGTAGIGLSFLTQLLASSTSTPINVLARTPSKLSSFTQSNLHITTGDIRSISALKSCLVHNGKLVDIAISSIGMTFHRKGLGLAPMDTTICEEGTASILQALQELEADPSILKPEGGRTKIVVLSTTGITDKVRDLPRAMKPLYSMLHVPHLDKQKMEVVVRESGRDFIVMRPSWLMNGKKLGGDALRISVEDPEVDYVKNVAIGYTISRAAVAGWILEECVLGGEKAWWKWNGKMVTLTY